MKTWSAADLRISPMLTVARRLGDLRDRVLFLGGAVVPLLITDPGAASARPTKDIDLSIEVTTRVEYYEFAERLRALGFSEDDEPGAPMCRWVIEELKVDIMPTEGSILGYTNSWFRAAMKAFALFPFTDGQILRVVSAPYFCATKLEAFDGRGEGDYVMSHDMEDILAIVDARAELFAELSTAEPSVKTYVGSTIRRLLGDPDFEDALPGHLYPDSASQARLPLLLERLQRLASLS